MDADELCLTLHSTDYPSVRDELKRRGTLNSAEWNIVSAHQIAIGMREVALLCSWGLARVNRTITAAAVRKQYVYGDRAYVYVENGRVTAI
jgi:hypothetical protein